MQLARLVLRTMCAVLALSSPWLLAGCSSADIEGVWSADGFCAHSMREDGLLVAGVVDATSGTDVTLGKWLAGIFREQLGEGEDRISARDSEVLAQELGSERYALLLDEYRSEGGLSTGTLSELAQSGIQDRYIFLARVVGNEVGNSQKSEYDEEAEAVKTTKITERTVEVIAHVFDLESGSLAWRAQASDTGSTGISFHEEKDDPGLLEQFFDAILGPESKKEPDYPDPPRLDHTLRPVLEDLAKELEKT